MLQAPGHYLCGPDALTGSRAITNGERFLEAFSFSIRMLATIVI